MSKKISGAEYPLAKIFSSDFEYIIPSYQRPYAWESEQAGELFEDLYDFYNNEKDGTYFLGSIVLIKEENKPLAEVIDGQQRLTTLTILLASIASLLQGEVRSDFERYLREPGSISQGLQPKPRLTLRERDRGFFVTYVQNLKFDELKKIPSHNLENESQKNIQVNSELFLKKLTDLFGNNLDDLCKFGSFLIQRCFLVAVSTPSQQSAFRVFSVLNNRGMDLLHSDIIKADIIGKIPSALQHEFTERWEALEVHTTRNGLNVLLGHIRMIFGKAKSRKTLLEDFKEQVQSKYGTPEDLIKNILEPYAEAYLIVKNQSYTATQDATLVNHLLKWLNRIDNADWIPPAILFLSKNMNDIQALIEFLTKLERVAAYLHICAKNINQRIDRYSIILEELDKNSSLQNPLYSLELTEDEKNEMKKALDNNIYTLTARRRNYLILRLDSFLSDGAASYDPSILTIEHVLPQTVTPGSEWEQIWPDATQRDMWVHRIANLVPLTRQKNSQAQNFDFKKKKEVYFQSRNKVSSYVLTTQVLATQNWDKTTLENRQQNLMKVMIENWEL